MEALAVGELEEQSELVEPSLNLQLHQQPELCWYCRLFRGSHPLVGTREATYSSLVFHMCHHLRLLTSFFEASFSADQIFGQRLALR